jgi:hypothetical protein
MAVMHDFKCAVHGYFESSSAICPHGCDTVQKVFLQPVGMVSDTTRFNDTTLRNLANDFKMGDIKSVKEGEAQPPTSDPFAVQWGSPSQIGNYNTASIAGEQVNGLAAAGGKFAKPTTASYIPDHQNLKVDN